LYTALSAAYDRARIEEVRDIPAISIVEPPRFRKVQTTSYGLRNVLLGTIAGMLIGIVIAFIRERMRETQTEASTHTRRIPISSAPTVADWRDRGGNSGRSRREGSAARDCIASSKCPNHIAFLTPRHREHQSFSWEQQQH
jgi:hypothetical protein